VSTHDRNTDAEQTAAWPGNQPAPSAPPVVPPTVPQAGGPPAWSPPTPAAGGWAPPVPPTPPGGYPPAGYPNHYGQPPATPPPAPKGPKKGLLAVLAIVVILAAVAAVIFLTPVSDKLFGDNDATTQAGSPASSTTASASTTSASPSAAGASTPSSAAPSPGAPAPAGVIVDPSDLQSYLATPDELSQRFAGADMQPQGLTKQPITDIDVSPFKCSSAAVPGMADAYSGTGFTGFVDQVVNESSGAHKFIQALITFPTADAAKNFVARQLSRWKDCSNADLTITIAGNSDHASTSAAASTDGVSSIVLTPPAAGSRQCERAMTASSNVVVDLRACAVNVGTAASTIARDIGQKITGQR